MMLSEISELPGKHWLGYIMLSLPSMWLLLRVIDNPVETGHFIDHVLHFFSALAILISLPYLLYLFIHVTNPEFLALHPRSIIGLVCVALLVGGVAYSLGKYNDLIMTCENFVVSGQDTPTNCVHKRR